MLTPDKIKAKQFQTTGRGSYRAEDVDSFLQEVHTSYEQVFRENGEIIKKMSLLANKVEVYKKDEDSLRQALLSAQKLADKIVADAKKSVEADLANAEQEAKKIVDDASQKAQKITSDAKKEADKTIHDAKKEADEIIGGVNRKVTQESLVFEMLQKEVSAFKSRMMDMYKEHLTLLDRLPSIAEEEQSASEPETAKAPEEEPSAAVGEDPVAEEEAPEEAVEENAENTQEDDGFSLSDIDTIDDTDAILDDSDTYEAAEENDISEDDESGFTFDSSAFDGEDEYQDISSDSSSDESSEEADGFSLDVSDLDLDVEEEKPEYETAEPESESDYDDDEDDDGAISFKSFFKKK